MGQSLNAYALHYQGTFAFSSILYPQPYRLALRLTFSGFLRGLRAYHVSYKYHDWGRSRLSAAGAASTVGDFIAPTPDHLPFWFKPVSPFGLLAVTTFNSDSHLLTLPITLAPDRFGTNGLRLPSQVQRTPSGEVTLSWRLYTPPLPVTHTPVGYWWQNTRL